jgi:hypothetical protein
VERLGEMPASYRQRRLSLRQQLAYTYVDTIAGSCIAASRALADSLKVAGVSDAAYGVALENLRREACVAVHFHPERLTRHGHSVAQGLLRDGVYKNQYETGTSSGSPTAFAGGERDAWECAMFGAAYADMSLARERPTYGALIMAPHPDGPGPRFGSCYFVLRPEVSHRCTFTWGGTNEENPLARSGTLENFGPVMAALLSQLERVPGALGIANLTGAYLVERMHSACAPTRAVQLGNVLDSFIEVQIHGAIDLRVDVASLVADPVFANGAIGALLEQLCARYGIELAWHPGYVLAVQNVPEEFRDYAIGPLARRIARAGTIDAASIGVAANAFHRAPADWAELGERDDALTAFRRLWHVLVERGVAAPRERR